MTMRPVSMRCLTACSREWGRTHPDGRRGSQSPAVLRRRIRGAVSVSLSKSWSPWRPPRAFKRAGRVVGSVGCGGGGRSGVSMMNVSVGGSMGTLLSCCCSCSFGGGTLKNCRRLVAASAEFVRRWGHKSPVIMGLYSVLVIGMHGSFSVFMWGAGGLGCLGGRAGDAGSDKGREFMSSEG